MRKQAGYTQQKLADKLGVGRSTVAMWETGAADPGTEMAKVIAELFGVPLDVLLETCAGIDDDSDLWALRESVRRDPERRELFNLARHADIEQVRQAVAIIDALKKTSGGGNNENP